MEQDQSRTANYECVTCRRSFLTLWCLQLHQKVHSDSVQWCEECGARFTCFSDLYQHLTIHISGEISPPLGSNRCVTGETGNNDLGRLRCETAQFLKESDHEVEKEWSGSDDMPDLNDGSGKYEGRNGSDRQIDANVSKNDGNNGEEACQFSGSSNGTRTMSCHLCHKSFSYKTILMLHLRKHKKKTPYKCQICALGFISWNAYKLHRKSYGNTPHKKRDPFKTAKKVSALPVGYCSKMLPQSARFPKTNSAFRSLLTSTSVEAKDGDDSSILVSKYSGWFMCLICGAKVRGRKGLLAHHQLFHIGHKLRTVKASRSPRLRRPWLKCSMCNKKMRSRMNLDVHEARCHQERTLTEESSEKVVDPVDASSGRCPRERRKLPEFVSELRHLSCKHGLTGPWRKCILCSRRCRGWHRFSRHLEQMHTDTYRSITTSSTSAISKSFNGLSRARSGNLKYTLSFTKCSDNMQCSWYSCFNCKRKFQGRKSMKRHHSTCSRITEVCGTHYGNTMSKRETVSWCKTSQKKNCSMYRCRLCSMAFKGRQRVVQHVRQCSKTKKQKPSGTFPARSGDVNGHNWLPSKSESQQQGHSSDGSNQLFRGTWTVCNKCGKTCKGYIDLCVHRKSCGQSETRNNPKTPGTEADVDVLSSNFWRYGCWYCCRSCKEKCRGHLGMIGHVCPPTSKFERYQTNWYRCRSCRLCCRSHQGMREHKCPPAGSSWDIESQPNTGPRTDLSNATEAASSISARQSSQYYAALYGFAQNGSWYKCNVCGKNCMGKWSLAKHTHDNKASSGEVMSDFSKSGTWYWCKVCKMRLRGEKSLKSHEHVVSKCSREEEQQWVVVNCPESPDVKTENGTPEASNECKEDIEESPVPLRGDNSDDGHDSKPQSETDGGQGEYFGWTVITAFSDEIHLQEPKVNGKE